jgi:hypothetical protein
MQKHAPLRLGCCRSCSPTYRFRTHQQAGENYLWRSLRAGAGRNRPISSEAASEFIWALMMRLLPLHTAFQMRPEPGMQRNWAVVPLLISKYAECAHEYLWLRALRASVASACMLPD